MKHEGFKHALSKWMTTPEEPLHNCITQFAMSARCTHSKEENMPSTSEKKNKTTFNIYCVTGLEIYFWPKSNPIAMSKQTLFCFY